MNVRIILAAAALLLSACVQPASAPPAGPEAVTPGAGIKVEWQAADTAEKCATISGDWRPICMRGMPACVVTYKDAGTACTDSSQCSGRCITGGTGARPDAPTTGICTTNSDPCGCFQIVENGKAGYPLCAD